MSQTIKVGIFMTVALVVLAYLIFKVEDWSLFGATGQRVEAGFESVVGLDDKAPVRVAGVRVGRVDGVRLEGQRAIVSLLLETPVELTEGARARIANVGLLGDKFVVLTLGPPGAPPLAPGTVLPGTTPVGFDDAMEKLSTIGDSIQTTLEALDPKATGESISRLLTNLEAASGAIRTLVETNREQVSGTIGNFERFSGTLADELPKLTNQIERVLEQVEGVVAENRGTLGEGLENVAAVAEKMRVSIDNLNEISGKIARGEGTVGKLVQSEETHDKLVSALGSVETGITNLSDTFGKIQKMKLDLGFSGYYLDELQDTHTEFSLTIDPQTNKFYKVGLVDDPRGRERVKSEVTTVTLPDGTVETTSLRRVTNEDKVTISAQFGFIFGDARVRGGLIESTGGAGLDYSLFDRRFWLSLDAYDFGREPDLDPHMRLTAKWVIHPNLYLLGGYDDFLIGERDSLFLGAGVRWSDDDLKYLVGSVPRF